MKYTGKINIKNYKNLMYSLIKLGYKSVDYDKINEKRKHVLIRHDVDFLPEDSLNFSKIEKEFNLKAYYFFLVRSEVYNINSNSCINVFKKIQSEGHEIGLHLDIPEDITSTTKINKIASEECKLLENSTKKRIKIISFHRPNKRLLNYNKKIAGRLHTYMPNFFKKIAYCSDSRGSWKYGHPLTKIAIKEGTAIQLLTHAEWWQLKDNINSDIALKNIFKKIQENNLLYFKNNISNFSKKKSMIDES